MNHIKHAWIGLLLLFVLALAAVIIGESSKLVWVSNWLAPILMLLFFVVLCTITTRLPKGVVTRRSKVLWWIRTGGLAGVIWLFLNIDLVGDVPVSMRLMGMSWTMSPYGAGRFLELGGLVLGLLACGLSWMDHRREAAAASLAELARRQNLSVPSAASTG